VPKRGSSGDVFVISHFIAAALGVKNFRAVERRGNFLERVKIFFPLRLL